MLQKYGFSKIENKISDINTENIGRITAQHNKIYNVITDEGEIKAEVSGKFIHGATEKSDFPVVGDWVVLRESEKKIIEYVIPRNNCISRNESGNRFSKNSFLSVQPIAANIDYAFIVSALDRDYNPRRIERYLTLVYNCGANPVILLNKMDLCPDYEDRVFEIEQIAYGVRVIPISASNDNSFEELDAYLAEGETAVLLGSSGVGKSTLINALIGSEKQKVKEISGAVNKGVHTTTHRELFLLPKGAILIDNPGMRELGITKTEGSITDVFSEIDELSRSCKFTDCTHGNEPGCAVRKAINDGTLSEERFNSFHKLQSEQEYLIMRETKTSEAIEKEKWKDIRMEIKRFYRDYKTNPKHRK